MPRRRPDTLPPFPDTLGLVSGEGLPPYGSAQYIQLLEHFHTVYALSPHGVQAQNLIAIRYGLRALIDLIMLGLTRMERDWAADARNPFTGACDLAGMFAPVQESAEAEVFQFMMGHYDHTLPRQADPEQRRELWEKSAHLGVEGIGVVPQWMQLCNQALAALHHRDALTARAILLQGPGLREKDPVLIYAITTICLQLS